MSAGGSMAGSAGRGATADPWAEVRAQFDRAPYPNFPLEMRVEDRASFFYVYDLTAPFYARDGRIPSTRGMRVLDAGCGSGFKALMLAKLNPDTTVVGVDLSPQSVEMARQRFAYWDASDRGEFHAIPLEEVGQLGQTFDYINCDETLYLLPDPVAGLRALASVLKPDGILRVNLHSIHQRAGFYRAQALFEWLGVMDWADDAAAMAAVFEVMDSIQDKTFLKKITWNQQFIADLDARGEQVFANHLLRGDRGFSISDLFSLLDEAGIQFVDLIDRATWQLSALFRNSEKLPQEVVQFCDEASDRERLALYELLNPVHRLLDCWCGFREKKVSQRFWETWTPEDWRKSRLALNPQLLRTNRFRAALESAIRSLRPLNLKLYLETPQPIESFNSGALPLLIPLLEGETQPFSTLLARLQRAYPANFMTGEAFDSASLENCAIAWLSELAAGSYVFVEPADA